VPVNTSPRDAAKNKQRDITRKQEADKYVEKVASVLLWVRDYLGNVLAAVGAIVLAFASFLSAPFNLWVGIVGGVVTLMGVVVGSKKVSEYRRLESQSSQSVNRVEVRSHGLVSILESALCALMEELSPIDFSKSRISLYRHKDDKFFMLVRVSKSQELEKVGREYYPDSEGIIGVTWDKGWGSVTGLPEDRQEWNDECVRDWNMGQDNVVSLNMQSRSLAGVRLDEESMGRHPIGVLIIESLNPRGVSSKINDMLEESASYPSLRLILVQAIKCLDEEDVAVFRRKQQKREI